MSITPGFTSAQVREFVHQYQLQPQGQKRLWLTAQGISYDRFRRWQVAVFAGDLDRGLIPRDNGAMTLPPGDRTALEKARASERATQEAELTRLSARVRELEDTNNALGKAIGLLHALGEQEPAEPPTRTDPSSS
jgi:hypothetical protein